MIQKSKYEIFMFVVFLVVCAKVAFAGKGDINGDCNVDLTDAVLALEALAAKYPPPAVRTKTDVSGNGKIGTEEIVYILQKIAGLRIDTEDSCPPNPYSTYFTNHPKISNASINTFDKETLCYFCMYIEELETTGSIPIDVPSELENCKAPESCPCIRPTDTEIKRILAAKAAHAIWLDKNNMLPWKLGDYNVNELAGLFDKDILFDSCSGDGFLSVVDHSPSDVYGYVIDNNLIRADILSTVHAVLGDLRTTDSKSSFVHGVSYYGDPTNTAYTLYDALTTYSDRGFTSVRIARRGCHSMSRIILGVLRSINIPGEETHSGEWYGKGHSSAVWPAIQSVLPHGDDIYTATLRVAPVEEFLATFPFYTNSENTEVCETDNICLSHRNRALLAITYPDNWTVQHCHNSDNYGYASCEDYLSDVYGSYLTLEEIANAARSIQNLNN